MTDVSLTIVGAGFSGTLLALHALRRCPPSTCVRLIERSSQFGRGQAYATGNPNHLLNVPAGRMSAFHDRPLDFLRWLRTQPCEADAAPTEHGFVPRRQFGAYVRHLLNEELKRPEADGRLELLRGDVLELRRDRAGLTLRLDRERELRADLVVLATGNFPPEPPAAATATLLNGPLFRPDPWAPEAFADLDPEAPVLLIGTGLTTVDSVVSLLDRGHRGPIHAISRRGLLPRRHAAPAVPPPAQLFALPTTLLSLLRTLRREAAAAERAGSNWQPVIDALRPFTQDLWQALSAVDRARFLRHLRPWWDVHRHRMPPAVADRVEATRRAGQLRLHRGRLLRIEPEGPDRAVVIFRPWRAATPERLSVCRVINAAGPGCDYDRIPHPLLRGLLLDGLARPDPCRLGLDVTDTCALLGRDGAMARDLFAVGPVTKGRFWEMTAVPDLRRQCETLAEHLATLARGLAAAAPRAGC
ncbi:FAD/NAD(P)-binding protein [Roseomonas sp. NAR14]|uniref:FAD/NAD(P)-binding protein n=1 Tax=Roseomonas acroporae TaxID=2937791 RepID=A0A9X1YD08_9PROT|nr:FAD/NAD(P)-binding protein [Roseomonas acroporae]MCK8784291.1 FAD/NAD(P)-binding protein [Roseomonas acroporae]